MTPHDENDPARDSLIDADENRRMFDAIARRYDLMNCVISLGLDRRWRRKAVGSLDPAGGPVLDIGTGTGDIAIEIIRQWADATVAGLDPAAQMLSIAARKIERAGVSASVSLQAGDALALPYADGSFSGAITAFCLRNVEDRPQMLREMHRVLRPGGRAVVLELSVPPNRLMRLLHAIHGRVFIPLAARLLSRGQAYRYLIESVRALPPPEAILSVMKDAGFESLRHIPLTFGVVSIYVGAKP